MNSFMFEILGKQNGGEMCNRGVRVTQYFTKEEKPVPYLVTIQIGDNKRVVMAVPSGQFTADPLSACVKLAKECLDSDPSMALTRFYIGVDAVHEIFYDNGDDVDGFMTHVVIRKEDLETMKSQLEIALPSLSEKIDTVFEKLYQREEVV